MAAQKATKKKVTKKIISKKIAPKATKKISKKSTSKKVISKKNIPKKIIKKSRAQKEVQKTKRFARATRRKIKIVLNNILFFSVSMLIFLVLYSASGTLAFQNAFIILTICSGAIVMAFLIVLLILVLLRFLNK